MDHEIHNAEPSDITSLVKIIEHRPRFVGNYSFIHLGSYRKEMVAVKILKLSGSSLHAMRRKFERERAIWALLSHPNIVPFYGYADDDKNFGPFGALISPWYELGDAGMFLEKFGEYLNQTMRVDLWQGVVAGVEYLHFHDPSIIHGDLKPGNILIDMEHTPKICDFGLAAIYHEEGGSGFTTTSEHAGTERYLAQELVLGEGELMPTTASDVWALGCIGLEFVYQQLPYSNRKNNRYGQIISDIRNGVSPAAEHDWSNISLDDTALRRLISECWTLNVQIRPDSGTLLETLERLRKERIRNDHGLAVNTIDPETTPRAPISPARVSADGEEIDDFPDRASPDLNPEGSTSDGALSRAISPAAFSAMSEATVLSVTMRVPLGLGPMTPPFTAKEILMSEEDVNRILDSAYSPWLSASKQTSGMLPVRRIVNLAQENKWKEGITMDSIKRDSALWRLIRAQQLWVEGCKELFKLQCSPVLPAAHAKPAMHYADNGAPLIAIECLAQSVLLDARVVSFRDADERRNFMNQLTRQIRSDANHTQLPELADLSCDLDEVFANAEARVQSAHAIDGTISKAFTSAIRNHVILGTLKESEGWTQAAILQYRRALDIIGWASKTFGQVCTIPSHEGSDGSQRIENAFGDVFTRGVHIRLGMTLVSQYNFVKKDPTCSSLRPVLLEEILARSTIILQSITESQARMTEEPYSTLEDYLANHVYHVAYALFFKGVYHKDSAKAILDMEKSGPDADAFKTARIRRIKSAFAFVQAVLLYPIDEEESIPCLEMALEELLKIGGIQVAVALDMFRSLKERKIITDELWNRPRGTDDDDQRDVLPSPISDRETATKVKFNIGIGTLKDSLFGKLDPSEKREPFKKPWNALRTLRSPGSLSQGLSEPATNAAPRRTHFSVHSLLLDNWLSTLQRTFEQKRITGDDILRAVPSLIGKMEIEWNEDEDQGGESDEELSSDVPIWAIWGMKAVKTATFGGFILEENIGVGIGNELASKDQDHSWTVVSKLEKKPLFVVDTSLFGRQTGI